MASFSVSLLRHTQPEAYPSWASLSALLGAVGYTLVAGFVWLTGAPTDYGHASLLTAAAALCWVGFVTARRGRPALGALLAFGALFAELHLALYLTDTFPSTPLLATPLMTIAAGLLFGASAAFWISLGSVLITTPVVLLSPGVELAEIQQNGLWLVVHAVATLGSWGIIRVSLSATKRIVEDLEAREEELETLIREAPDGILLLSSSNQVVAANREAERMLGATGAASRRPSLATVLREAGAADADALVAQIDAQERGDGGGNPVLWALPDTSAGAPFVEVTQRPVSKDRRQLMLRDVSPRVNAEHSERETDQRRAHAQRLEALGQLAGGIAHDFNNLLLTIGANAELLRGPLTEEEQTTVLDELSSAQERGASLTRQLLAFARKDTMRATVFDLSALVADKARLFQRVAGDGVHLRVATDGRALVRADPLQLEQVLVNLVANARDAMPNGGVCSIEVERDVATDGTDVVCVRVADTGTGMDPATAARAVEPFFTTKPRGRGTGLGLSTAHGIVAQCKGKLEIVSVPREGTQVRVTLPQAAAQPGSVSEAPRDPSASAAVATPELAARILVAEDDDSTRAVVGRILGRAGYACTLVPDGEQAVRAVEQATEPFDLVLSDVAMPVLDGPRMAKQLRERHPELPILFMSGYPESGFDALVSFDPERDFLAKPFTSAELLRRVEALLVEVARR